MDADLISELLVIFWGEIKLIEAGHWCHSLSRFHCHPGLAPIAQCLESKMLVFKLLQS